MHMAWARYTCGRLKSDFRYSKDIVNNNYPWPTNIPQERREAVENAAQAVLDARAAFLFEQYRKRRWFAQQAELRRLLRKQDRRLRRQVSS